MDMKEITRSHKIHLEQLILYIKICKQHIFILLYLKNEDVTQFGFYSSGECAQHS